MIFRIGNVENIKDCSDIRLTIDESQDWQLIEKIFLKLYPKNPTFKLSDILSLLEDNPELLKINKGIIKNEGYLKSLESDYYTNNSI
jgi:spore coat polysaccharide biosynthesis protein SpsF